MELQQSNIESLSPAQRNLIQDKNAGKKIKDPQRKLREDKFKTGPFKGF